MGNNESLMGPSPQDNRFASCVSLVAMSSSGAHPYGHTHTRQLYDRAKIVIHECSEAEFDGDEIYAKNFEVTSSYLEPSTSYLLEIKFNYRSSDRTVDVYLQGRMVASGPYDFFPCKRAAGSNLGCDLSQESNYPHSVWFGDNAPVSYSSSGSDDNHWPGVVSAGNPGEVFTFMTDWGGLFSRAWSADDNPTDDWACVHDGRCGYLTGAQGTWGNWTSGELHFCPYPTDAPVAPAFDRDMFVATHACENCFPANKSSARAFSSDRLWASRTRIQSRTIDCFASSRRRCPANTPWAAPCPLASRGSSRIQANPPSSNFARRGRGICRASP